MSSNKFINADEDTNRLQDRFQLDFPGHMNDGRQLTDYRSSGLYNLPEKQMSTYKYRLFLKHNADKFINNYNTINDFISNPNWDDNKCKTCSDYQISPSYLPLICDNNCTTEINKRAGVGDYYVDNNN